MMPADALRKLAEMADIKDLEPTAKRLNAATDSLNHVLQIIEDRLNALGVGLEVWLDGSDALDESAWSDRLDDRGEPTGGREFVAAQLGYGRLGDGWALLVRNRRYVDSGPDGYGGRNVDEYDEGREQALLRSSRKLRLAAIPKVPKLIDVLKAEAENAIEAVEQAKAIAESLK